MVESLCEGRAASTRQKPNMRRIASHDRLQFGENSGNYIAGTVLEQLYAICGPLPATGNVGRRVESDRRRGSEWVVDTGPEHGVYIVRARVGVCMYVDSPTI